MHNKRINIQKTKQNLKLLSKPEELIDFYKGLYKKLRLKPGKFRNIVEFDPNTFDPYTFEENKPDIPGAEKCATPTIKYENGKLIFECEMYSGKQNRININFIF